MGRSSRGAKQRLTWTPPPPQGFKNSPAISGKALASDLDSLHSEEYGCWLLQYVDDLLLAAETKENCWEGMNAVLQLPMETGYRGSKKKARIWKEEARYLGFVLKRAQRLLDQSRKDVILRAPTPKTRRQVREFSGATGFCRIWIPGYSQMFQPLYELLTGPEENPLNWTEK